MANSSNPEVVVRPSSKKPLVLAAAVLSIIAVAGLYRSNLLRQTPPKTQNQSVNFALKCPVEKRFCKDGKTGPVLTYSNLATNSAVFAVMDGKLDSQPPQFSLTNQKLGLKVTYEFNPKAYTSSGVEGFEVKQGATVGWTAKGSLKISVQNLKTNEVIKLDPNVLVGNSR